jgi:hypothetical protein
MIVPISTKRLRCSAGAIFFAEESWGDDDFFYARTDFEHQWLAEGRTMNCLSLRCV